MAESFLVLKIQIAFDGWVGRKLIRLCLPLLLARN